MRKAIVIFICLLLPVFGQAQEYFNPVGANSRALADVSVCFHDPWSAFNNQAGLALVRFPAIGIFAENKFNLKELNGGAFILAYPLKENGTLALDFYIFNYSVLFSRQKLGLSYALQLSKSLSAGIQMNYLRTITENYQTRNTFFGEAGMLYFLNNKTRLGFHVFNPTSVRYDKFSNERVPVILNLGAAFMAGENVLLLSEIEHSSDFGYGIKGGIEFSMNEHIKLRGGFRTMPVISTFGLSLIIAGFHIDIAFQFHQILGNSPSFSAYRMFEPEKVNKTD